MTTCKNIYCIYCLDGICLLPDEELIEMENCMDCFCLDLEDDGFYPQHLKSIERAKRQLEQLRQEISALRKAIEVDKNKIS